MDLGSPCIYIYRYIYIDIDMCVCIWSYNETPRALRVKASSNFQSVVRETPGVVYEVRYGFCIFSNSATSGGTCNKQKARDAQ
jgi:hypothetical protein